MGAVTCQSIPRFLSWSRVVVRLAGACGARTGGQLAKSLVLLLAGSDQSFAVTESLDISHVRR